MMPRVLARCYAKSLIGFAVFMLAGMSLYGAVVHQGVYATICTGITIVLVAVSQILTIWSIVVWWKLRSAVREHGGAVCGRCGYGLVGLAEKGNCPECGEKFHIQELVQDWREVGILR
jgi:hypothetical protein